MRWSIGHLTIAVIAIAAARPARAEDDRAIVVVKQMQTEKRVALVIGNSAYANSPLRNPKHDAQLIAKTLEAVGFSVITILDADQKRLKRAIADFGNHVAQGGISLFYYAGHAVQVNGRNYMIPTDASIAAEADIEIESVDVAAVMARMSTAKNRMNIIILDACRNNPFARSFRSSTKGLAVTDAPEGTLIAYATAPGDIAADGDGDNSPYTDALARHMRVRGVEIGQMFRGVRSDVRKRTNGKQTPWESSSVEGQFYFVMPDSIVAPPEAPAARGDKTASTSKPAGGRGQLWVETDMPGASITIDGKPAGIIPAALTGIAAGYHRIEARKGNHVGVAEVVIRENQPNNVFIDMQHRSRLEIGAEGMFGFIGDRADGGSIDDTRLISIAGHVGARIKLRESESGRHWLQVSAGVGVFEVEEPGHAGGDVGYFAAVLQSYRIPLAADLVRATKALDISAGPYFASSVESELGAMARIDLLLWFAAPGIWATFGSESSVSAGVGLGLRWGP